jgi:hypothetical protein
MKKHLTIILIVSLVSLATGVQAFGRGKGKDPVPQAEKIKAKVAKLGTGEKAKAKVRLRSGEKLKGYISNAGENDFTITDKKSGQSKTVAYADVDEVKKPGLSKGTKIAIVVVIGAVATAAILALVIANTFPNFTLSNTPR